EEAPHKELQGNLYYIKYPLKDNPKEFITVATTRPETMLGDTAVAVNPKDKRYKKLIGKTLILPLIEREIKIIKDPMVDMKFGTGAVKVTPAHDPNDYILGKKHGLDFINVMHPDARMNESSGKYKNMDRFKAREIILEDLQERGLLEKVEPHALSAGHCYRCHTIIEPYLSKQWFVKMKPLAEPALSAVKKGKIKFYPQRWTKVYLSWMENIQDWCISRQIWWGHRIPVYYCSKCREDGKSQIPNPKSQTGLERGVIVSRAKPKECPVCGSSDIYQDEDVLDTWFSSWLWPFATFYWPKPSEDLKYFYPTSTLVTAPEIIFFWVARMIMAGFEFIGKEPFRDVYIHGTVRDIEGKKMSKSLGNIIDPLEIIDEYGADALRFSIISITSQGQDVFLSKERFEQGRNFANKVWNASRFILMNLEEGLVNKDLCEFAKQEELDDTNRWILSRLYSVLKETEKNIQIYRFNEAVNALYGFFWHEFCDWYLEIIKADIKNNRNQVVMYKVLEKFLRALHPFMPFISEEVWHRLNPKGGPIMVSAWPHTQQQFIDKKLEKQMRSVFELVTQIRNLRGSIDIKPEQEIEVSVYAHSKEKESLIRNSSSLIINLARLKELRLLNKAIRPQATISDVIEDTDIFLHFTGLLDINKEQAKIKDKHSQLIKIKEAKEVRLKNRDFLKNAPAQIVEKERQGIEELAQAIRRLKKMLEELK
ncbi:MAG: valine--tRNA ligase, partial [Candidatus Omnitrophica bacterium]|nr:valine--tRNA ligase [Candidatus Omnitrophota bacterium]